MTDAERDTLTRIHQALVGFRSGAMNLASLIEEVPSLVKQLDPPSPEWKNEFVSYWWTLENVHEEAIEAGEARRLPPERRDAVDDAVAGMLRLSESALHG